RRIDHGQCHPVPQDLFKKAFLYARGQGRVEGGGEHHSLFYPGRADRGLCYPACRNARLVGFLDHRGLPPSHCPLLSSISKSFKPKNQWRTITPNCGPTVILATSFPYTLIF